MFAIQAARAGAAMPPTRAAMSRVRTILRPVAIAILLPMCWLATTLPMSSPTGSRAYAEEEKSSLGIIHFVKRGEVGALSVQRIEEYLRQMLDAAGYAKMIAAKTTETGKPLGGGAAAAQRDRPASPGTKALEKADKLMAAARDMLAESGENAEDAAKLLRAASDRYEQNFAELVDFSRLTDAYVALGSLALDAGDQKTAGEWLTKALVVQPSLVVDARKHKDLKVFVEKTRQALDAKPRADIGVECREEGSDVYVDGVKIGTAPATAKDLAFGTHYLQVRKSTAAPWGQAVALKGKPLSVRAVLQIEVAPQDEIAVGVSPDDIKDMANKGNFGEKIFKNSGSMYARQVGASHLLFGLVSKRPSSLELHLFLYNAKTKKTCSIDKIEYAPNLSNLQMQTLDAESKVHAALQNCSSDVAVVPSCYAGAPEVPDVAPDAPDIVTPPDDNPRVEPKVEPKVEPRVEPKIEPKTDTKVKPKVVKDPIPDDPYAKLLDPDKDKDATPIYKTWWFWTAVGVVVVGGAGAGIYAGSQSGAAASGYGAHVQF